jgi:ATP-binding cassette subfamily F protein 3
MPLVTFSNVSKFFGARDIVKGANWAIEDGRRIGLIGNNGTGKTTLFKMLLGEEDASSGSISRQRGLTVGHLSQHPSFEPGHTLIQEMLMAKPELAGLQDKMTELEHQMADPAVANDAARMEKVMEKYGSLQEQFIAHDGYSYESEAQGVLEAMHFSKAEYHRPVDSFSGGEKTRLMLAKLLISKPQLLLLDEPTNHLDTRMCEWLEAFLLDYPGSIVCISHDRYFLDNVVTEVVEMKDCKLTYYPGNYTYYKENKEKQQELVAKAFEEQKAHIARTQDFIARNIVGQNTKQAQSRRRALEKLERVEGPERKARGMGFEINQRQASGKEVVKFEHVGKAFGERRLLKPFEAILYRSHRVGLIGPNGCGKSTLLKVLTGKEPATEGKTILGSGVQLGYYDQFQASLDPKNTVMEEIWKLLPGEGQQSIRGLGGRFLFSGADIDKKVSSLSGGEKARLMLAQLMIQGPNFLVMDEPTNHLDILSREVVEEALDDFEGSLLVVSHDRYFLDRECDKIWEVVDGRIETYEGNYTEYRAEKAKREAEAAANPSKPVKNKVVVEAPSQSETEREERKADQRKTEQLKKRQQELEGRIAELEAMKKELEDKFLDPDLANDAKRLLQLKATYEGCKKELDGAFDKWQELEARKD